MKIILIRHGDPDYANDTLTEKGHREAKLLAERMSRIEIDAAYVSPLGRARDTAAYTLDMKGIKAETKDWLREFPAVIDLNLNQRLSEVYPDTRIQGGKYRPRIMWDMLPSYYTEHPEYADVQAWRFAEAVKSSNMTEIYDTVIMAFDDFLSEFGYVREGNHYRVEKEYSGTVVLFCHFGIICALLSHLFHASPFLLWQSIALLPTSFTEVVTEEREQGIASFRAIRLGDLSHLDAGGEEPSFQARFCEVYSNTEERH